MDPLDLAPLDPTAGSATMVKNKDYRVLQKFPRVSHEGINFSRNHPDTVIYYVDEDNSGSIYKMVLTNPGDYTQGQSFVLSVDAFAATGGQAELLWNEAGNVQAARTGTATWVPVTDRKGNKRPGISNPFSPQGVGYRQGRVAADDVGGTPYGRPEDMSIGISAAGNDRLYFTATSEAAVYSVEDLGNGTAAVKLFASNAATPRNDGYAPTTASLNSPDNLAIDALGNIYIIEDAPNSSSTGGDIWFARDVDDDGVAESIDHFLSIQVAGSEATGMIFNPVRPTEFVVAIQHPTSTNKADNPDGHEGDALWKFTIGDGVDAGFLEALENAETDPINP